MKMTSVEMARRSAATVSGCAALKHWFKAEEASAAVSIVDAISGLTVPVTSCNRLGNSNGIAVTTANDVAIAGGAWTDPGSNDFMMVSAVKMTALDQLRYGLIAGPYIVCGSVLAMAVDDGVNNYQADSIDNDGKVHSAVLRFDEDASLTGNHDTDAAVVDDLTAPDVGAIALDDVATFNVPELYTSMLFVFANGMPANALSAGMWMADQAIQGNKVLHPSCANWD